jgi:hypothetical protein
MHAALPLRTLEQFRFEIVACGGANPPCDNLAARICGQILAEQSNFFKVELL